MFTTELKKFFQPMLLLVAVLISLVYYGLDLNFIHTYWPNGYMIPFYDYASDWQDRFGQMIEDDDLPLIEQDYQHLVEEVNKQVADSPFGKERHIKNVVELEQWQTEHLPDVSFEKMSQDEQFLLQQVNEFYDHLVDQNGQSLTQKISVYQEIIEQVELLSSKERFFKASAYTEKEQTELSTVLFEQPQSWRNILPPGLSTQISGYFRNILLLIIFLLSLLIPAVLVRDRMLGLQTIQWSSRHGRKIVWTQFKVAITASFIVITVTLALFGSLIFSADYTKFFGNGLNSFFPNMFSDSLATISFYNWSFNRWLLIIILLVYLIGISYSTLLFFLSQTSNHYLSLLMKLIPIGFVFIFMGYQLITDAFYLDNALYQLTKIPMIELYTACALLILGSCFGLYPCIRNQSKDLLI